MKKTLFGAILVATLAFGANAAGEFIIGVVGAYREPFDELLDNAKIQGIHAREIFGIQTTLLAAAKDEEMDALLADRSFLESQKGVKFTSFTEVGVGTLVVASRHDITDFSQLRNMRVAVPIYKDSIFGKCADEFLRNKKLALKQVVRAESARDAARLAAEDVADAAITNLASARAYSWAFERILPIESGYTRPQLVIGWTQQCENDASCGKFARFMRTPLAKRILKKYGL